MAGNIVYFPYETLKKLSMDAFQKFGFTEKEADIIQDVLLTSDLFGIQSHGMQRMVRYHKGITSGLIKIASKGKVVFETPISAVIDGEDGMGQLIGHKAMEMAIEKAKKSGVGIVSVRNSNHYGIAGYYAKMASDQGLIGFSCTNSEAIMVPTYARKAMLGSNPLAWTVPADPVDFFFDCSTTVVTRGKLEMYNKMGKATPDGWAVNKDGVPSTNAAEVLGNISRHEGGGILPLGGATEISGSHKGYGNGMIAELFASILSQGGTSNKCMKDGRSNICHGFMAINPAFFGDPAEIKAHFSTFLQELRDAPKADGQPRIYTHGEKEHESVARVLKEGVPIIEGTMVEVQDLCNELGLDFKSYFGDYVPKAPQTMFKGNY
ncbi:Ldh family oxidoreductase [Veillonella montpellierensis]|uniref:Ldh family oxidoreductase n=1 Tax=Veillonella montpellierensis TaxID=187328 RepID=UPI0023F96236|nr:Ldh family oxidoreductase [Veillonella montpellierensis]